MGKNISLISILLFLVSCASSPIDVSSKKIAPTGETIVFGRIKVIDEGTPITWPSSTLQRGFSRRGVFTIFIVPEIGSKAVAHDLTDDGSFYWYLPKGRYFITGFEWKIATFTTGGRIPARFEVPAGQPLVYLGTLTIDMHGRRYAFRVDNEQQQALQNLKSKFPEVKGTPVESLLQLEVTQ
ncbi:MAG: hypothetical protein P8X65_08325 [Syntrophobacterales bacterium]|jgi:hypothetical protein